MVNDGPSTNTDTLLGVCLALTILTGLCILVRLYGRIVIIHNCQFDDWLTLSAWLLIVVYLAILKAGVANGLGSPLKEVDETKSPILNKLGIASQIIYTWAVVTIKASIIASYLRIALSQTFRIVCYTTMVLLTIFGFAYSLSLLLQCIPLHVLWTMPSEVFQRCNSTYAILYAISVVNIISDVWIVALPFRTISRAGRPYREMAIIYFIIMLPLLEIFATALRISAIRTFSHSEEPLLTIFAVHFWAYVELGIAMICACIPTFRPFTSLSLRQIDLERKRKTQYTIRSRESQPSSSPMSRPSCTLTTPTSQPNTNGRETSKALPGNFSMPNRLPRAMDLQAHYERFSSIPQSISSTDDKGTLKESREGDWLELGLELVVLPNGRVAPAGMVE